MWNKFELILYLSTWTKVSNATYFCVRLNLSVQFSHHQFGFWETFQANIFWWIWLISKSSKHYSFLFCCYLMLFKLTSIMSILLSHLWLFFQISLYPRINEDVPDYYGIILFHSKNNDVTKWMFCELNHAKLHLATWWKLVSKKPKLM